MKLDKANIPAHISIIMDGNGRWAQKQDRGRSYGHEKGVETVIDIVEHSRKLNIEHLTLYAFSTENWKRPDYEIDFIMNLVIEYIEEKLHILKENGVKIKVLGDYTKVPIETYEAIEKAIEATKNNDSMILNIGLNYGGRDEILMASKHIAKLAMDGKIAIDEIDHELFQSYLYTSGQPDPDLMIRTGSEKRISNFLVYQSVYTELYFTDILWPDFTIYDLEDAIIDYQNRKRRYGGLDD